MKISLPLVLLTLLTVAQAVSPPQPVCLVSPLPSVIPVTVGESLRFDLERVFNGFNLFFDSNNSGHIKVQNKYETITTDFQHGMNFTSVKLKANGRFLGLITNDEYTSLAIGFNNDSTGVNITDHIEVQNIPNLHCFDVDEATTTNGQYAIIDCGTMVMGKLFYNQFLYVDLQTMKVEEGSRLTDTFVNYNQVIKRKIEVVHDPFSRMDYLVRFQLRDGVDVEHQNENYFQVFMIPNPRRPQLLDVLDHTFFGLSQLSISDYQIHMGLIYVLVYNKGLYQVRMTPDQRFELRSFFEIKMDVTQFHVDQLGFNDDLNLVLTNGNSVYQYEWDVTVPPTLTAKYSLIPNSEVEEIFTDYNFVIVQAKSNIDGQIIRRTWFFTRRTLSYINAYNMFPEPVFGPAIIVWQQHGSVLHVFHEYSSLNVKMSLPYLLLAPVDASHVGETEEYVVTATSFVSDAIYRKCDQKFKFVYVLPNDTQVFRTGLAPSGEIIVDSPDTRQIPLSYEFYGANLTYQIKFTSNDTVLPFAYSDKQHQGVFNWPPGIAPETIVYYEMFTEQVPDDMKPSSVYGLVQVAVGATPVYTLHYINCAINIMDRDDTHHLNCRIITSTVFSQGLILFSSQIFSQKERRIAFVFDSLPHSVWIYYFWEIGFGYYGRKDYGADAGHELSAVAISRGMLFTVLEYGKRVEIFSLSSLEDNGAVPPNPNPIMVLNSIIMGFFGVTYFAPVGIKVSALHDQVIFLKTKSGVMAVNINEMAFPQLIFHVKTTNVNYDFEVNHNSLLIISDKQTTLYGLLTPLRRIDPPLQLQTLSTSFKLNQYDQICSDRLFYIVGSNSILVINPAMSSTSILYSQIYFSDPIQSIDAVNIIDKEILFIRTKLNLTAYVFAQEPKLYIDWTQLQNDFQFSLSASNPTSTSDAYTQKFTVLHNNQTKIIPTSQFNATEVQQLGNIAVDTNNVTFYATIPINDSTWFDGTILRYRINCSQCDKTVFLTNHVEETREVVQARGIYDIESNYQGIFAQQYFTVMKTHYHNDSIQYIVTLPVESSNQYCNKIAVGEYNEFVISVCELGNSVNVYITSLIASKPFTMGPFKTEAKAVNHAKIVGDLLMIVDNDDNPYTRAGGVFLYKLNLDLEDEVELTLLDYLDYEDLQLEGFTGVPYIGSADIHQPFFLSYNEYRIFITEGRTGALFVFTFQLTPDQQQIVYLSRKWVPLTELLKGMSAPTPVRVMTITIHYHIEKSKRSIEYYLLLTVSNWHHMQVMISLASDDKIEFFKLIRLFERFPWELKNYIRYKRTASYETNFAVSYVSYPLRMQTVAIYYIPYILNAESTDYDLKYSPHAYELRDGVPLLKIIGSHIVKDATEVAYAFQTFGDRKMLFTDIDGYNITELTISSNLTLTVDGMPKPKQSVDIQAFNSYENFTFKVSLDFKYIPPIPPGPDPEKEGYLWIILIVIASLVIIGLLIAWIKQQKAQRAQEDGIIKDSLLTVEDEYKNAYINNRTSADPDSVRESSDLRVSARLN